jgi:hypothetical protein
MNSPAACDGPCGLSGSVPHGGESNVVFFHHVLRLALPNLDSPDPGELAPVENAAAVDKVFGLLLECLDEVEQRA